MYIHTINARGSATSKCQLILIFYITPREEFASKSEQWDDAALTHIYTYAMKSETSLFNATPQY